MAKGACFGGPPPLPDFRPNQARTTGGASFSREGNLWYRRFVFASVLRGGSTLGDLGRATGGQMTVPDYRAREADDRGFDEPTLPQPLPREHLEAQEHAEASEDPRPPAQHRRRRLMLVIALSLVLVEVAWVVALSVFTYRAVT